MSGQPMNGEQKSEPPSLYKLADKQGDIITNQGPALARIETKVDDLADDHRRLEANVSKLTDASVANTAATTRLAEIEEGRIAFLREIWKVFKPLLVALVGAACIAISAWGLRG